MLIILLILYPVAEIDLDYIIPEKGQKNPFGCKAVIIKDIVIVFHFFVFILAFEKYQLRPSNKEIMLP